MELAKTFFFVKSKIGSYTSINCKLLLIEYVPNNVWGTTSVL